MISTQDLLTHKSLFDSFLARDECRVSCYHFSSVFAWQDFFHFTFEVIRDRLCVFAHQPQGCFLYMPPVGGPLDLSTLEECFQRMGKNGLARVENICDNQLPALVFKEYNSRHKADEYIYRRQDIAGLRGKAYKSRRHDVNLAVRQQPIFEHYEDRHYEGCTALYERWAVDRARGRDESTYRAMLEDNRRVHALVIAHAKTLGLIGCVLIVDGEVAAYTFGYPQNDHTFCVLFEVADLARPGLASYIFNRLCADEALGPFEFVNAMDDFGMPGVARAKELFRPVFKAALYTLTKI
ncbi:MAG: DUF2156 domain-containing protein [Candidatus Omnitrophica bacterium]|nr:DUF2156 domain-containing protein [Candidatus Omnitrophota bacterium]